MLVVGPPGSGKSSLVHNLLTNKRLYAKRFEIVHIFSPSLRTMKLPLEKSHQHEDLDLSIVEKECKTLRKGECAFFLFDDMVNDIQKGAGLKPFLKLAYNRRHLGGEGASLMITTQKLTKVDLALRTAVSVVILYRTANNKEIRAAYEEYCNLSWETWKKLLAYAWEGNGHDFLMIRLDIPNEEDRYFKSLAPIKFLAT